MDITKDNQLNRNLRRNLERVEMENMKLKKELDHTFANEGRFRKKLFFSS